MAYMRRKRGLNAQVILSAEQLQTGGMEANGSAKLYLNLFALAFRSNVPCAGLLRMNDLRRIGLIHTILYTQSLARGSTQQGRVHRSL